MYFQIFLLCFVFGILPSAAQDKSEIKSAAKDARKVALRIHLEKVGIIYPIENNFGFRLSSNGLSGYYENLKFLTVNKKRLITADLFYFVDFMEKQITTYPFTSSSVQSTYYYGKLNDMFGVRLSYGLRKALSEKTENDEVQVSYTIAGGVTLGILKPYFLDISYGKIVQVNVNQYSYDETNEVAESFSKTNANIFLSQQIVAVGSDRYAYIKGTSSFSEGFAHLQLIPGLHGRFAFNFDWGTKDEIVKQMEVGIMVDVYNKAIPLYINNYNSQFNFSLFYSVGIGRRRTLHTKRDREEENQ